MAMNKTERALLDTYVTGMRQARALRWPEFEPPAPMTRAEIDLELAGPNAIEVERYSSTTRVFKGWYFNEYRGCVEPVGAAAVHYCYFDHTGMKVSGWTQAARIYRTREDALRALRHVMTVKAANELAAIDALIEKEVMG